MLALGVALMVLAVGSFAAAAVVVLQTRRRAASGSAASRAGSGVALGLVLIAVVTGVYGIVALRGPVLGIGVATTL